ncbi:MULTISPECIES: hypothetical protein [Yersiniaceae]|uniref:Uncharacterized protein n=1 Tax=Nissabacter archeti TaxID=1917880 RepID=A0ABS5JKT5_9GAMM|nr:MULTISPECIES: hypothetical protein [Yersiniaceae]MBS0970530.1 hypothetical protein [Nissabacter archeti]
MNERKAHLNQNYGRGQGLIPGLRGSTRHISAPAAAGISLARALLSQAHCPGQDNIVH